MSSGKALAIQRAKIMKGALILHGVPEVSIEVQEGRPTYGDAWNAVKPVGATSHHIASRPTEKSPTPGLSLIKHGRSDLPGPLANGTAGVDLVYRIVCMGYANHSGYGGPMTLSGPLGTYTVPKDLGRPYLWGTEYEGGYDDAVWDRVYTNKRTGVSMTFREFMGRCNAGLTYGIWLINGLGKRPELGEDYSGYQHEHKTWAPGRKPDRLNYTTSSGRAEARAFYQQEDDMPTPEDLWGHKIETKGKDDEKKMMPAEVMLSQTHNRAKASREAASASLRQAQKNSNAIKKIAESLEDLAPGVAQEVVEALGEMEQDAEPCE